MKILSLCSFLIALIGSCAPYEPSEKELKKVFKESHYDKKIIADFPVYDSLAQFLLSHSDTIFKYKDSKNYVGTISSGKETKVLMPERSYWFFDGNDYYDLKRIPEFLSVKADRLWTSAGKPEIEIFKEQEPALLSIRVSFIKKDNNILECHFLYWHLQNFSNHDSFDFVKDTALSKHCIYRVGITMDHSGW